MPVILYDETAVRETKDRRITLHKEPMAQEIDGHTSKFVDAANMPTNLQSDTVASDTDETLDGTLIGQFMEYRDAKLRKFLKGSMKKETEITEVDNYLDASPDFLYDLTLPVEFNDALLRPLALLMHKYIVWGCLFDWYSQLGLAEASIYGQQLKDIEEEIQDNLYPAGYAKRPMQPFGPAKRMI